MILTFNAAKMLAKFVYELRAEATSLSVVQGMAPEIRLVQEALTRKATSIELIVNQAVSQADEALTQGERDQIWLLIREGRSRVA